MKIALRLLCRLRWIFKDHEENPFSPETFALSNIIKKKKYAFLNTHAHEKVPLPPHYYSKITEHYSRLRSGQA